MNKNVLWIGLGLVGLAGAGWWYVQQGQSVTKLGAGEPLPAVSMAKIEVLKEAAAPAGVVVADGTTAAPEVGAVSVTEVVPVMAEVTRLPDVAGLKFGTLVSLLTQAYANGGPLARELANVAADVVAKARVGGELRSAVQNLRDMTPIEGPMTPLALVSEAMRVERMGAPTNLPEVASAEADSWLVRQMKKLVRIETGADASQTAWQTKVQLVSLQLARGQGSDGLLTLREVPLAGDARLDGLRKMVETYLDQRARLDNVVRAFVRTSLLEEEVGR